MRPSLTDGRWFDVKTELEHRNMVMYGIPNNDIMKRYMSRVQIGTYVGPGRYLLLSYQRKCPRGCCYDDVHEVICAEEVVEDTREKIRELANLLKKAKGYE